MMFILFFALFALSKATDIYQSPYYVRSSGTSNQYRDQDASGNYRFGYDESHASGGTFRDETGDAWGNKWGSYGLHEADGRYRVVNYVADDQGFRAEVKSNEPGLAPEDPASTTVKRIHSEVIQKPHREVVQKPHREVVQKPFSEVVQKPQSEVVQKPVLYSAPAPAPVATVLHHPYNPEYPLLYSSPYYAPISTYKGTPFRRYGVHAIPRPFFSQKGAPLVTNKGFYIYP